MVDSIYQDTTLFDLIPVFNGDVSGEDVRYAVELTRSHGGGARSAGEFLPVDSPESFKQSVVNLKRFYYTLSLDGFVMENFRKPGAFVDYLSLRMQNAQRDAANQLNRICHMDGTGVVALCKTTQTANVIDLKHVHGYSFGATQFLEEGDSISVIDGATGATKASAIINTMSWANQTITLKNAQTISVNANDKIVFGDSHSNSFEKEAKGLRHLIANTGTVQDIPCADFRRWRSTIIDKTAAPVPYDWTHVTRIVSSTMYKGSAQPQSCVLLMHPAMLEEHQRLVDPDIRYEATDFKLNKGLEIPTFSILGKKVPVRDTIHMGFQEIVSLNTAELERLELAPMDFDDRGGEIKAVQGKDAAYAFLKYYFAIAAKSLNHLARFDGIQVDTEYVQVLQETA
tara:strand:- start:6521 stop:7717 length:1197 start_codon:yes stop_codon:yes gene_type:complete